MNKETQEQNSGKGRVILVSLLLKVELNVGSAIV